MKAWSTTAVLLAALAALPARAADDGPAPRGSRPNFVVVLVDDLGYGDLGCYGDRVVQSPNLDRLAAEGLRLTNCYSGHPNCSPSRAALLTGRTPFRMGIHNWIPQGSPMHLRKSERTIASLLRAAGYATGLAGKWHLSGGFDLPDQPLPSEHGFDYWFATQNFALPNHRNPNNFVRNGRPLGKLEGYSAPLVAKEAIHWLRDVRQREKPFFLFVCFHEPHEPIATAPRYIQLYPPGKPSRSDFYGNITQMDDAFGQIMKELDVQRLRDHTLVFFTSDNGPAITAIHPHGSAGPLRDKKGSLYEGGIRVPGILRWPGHIRAGQVSAEPVSGVDVLPTFCALAGIDTPRGRPLDGANLQPLFAGKPVVRRTPLYWQFNRAHSRPKVALRVGDWKLLATLTGPELRPGADILATEGQTIRQAELASFELYNLKDDVGESKDLAAQEPERLRELSAQLRRLYHEVRDESPVWPAWTWPRTEQRRIEWPPYWKPAPRKR